MNEELRFELNNQLFGDGDGTPPTEPPVEPPKEPAAETVDKKLLDKALSEKAELKRMLSAKQTEDELKEQEQLEKERELEELKSFKVKSELENGLLKGGIAQEDVDSISKAILSGKTQDISKVLSEVIKNTKENTKKEIEAELLNDTPRPNGSNANTETTVDDFRKMNIDERTQLKLSNPELYEKLKNA